MKNILKTVLFAISATALTFCSEDEAVNPTPASGLKINVSASSTRTVFDTDNIKWSGSEEMTLYINGTKNKSNALADVDNTTGAARFLFETNITAPGAVKLQGVVPAASVLEVHTGDAANNNAGVLKMELNPEQASTVETFDPAADILVSKDVDYNITTDDIDTGMIDAEFYFGRIMAITRYDVTNTSARVSSDEIVEYVKLDLVVGENNATKGLTGRFYFDISNGCFVDNKGVRVEASVNPFYQGQSQTYVRTTYAEESRPKLGELKFWAVTAPVALEAGDKLVFTIKTDKNTIVKTSTLKSAVSFVNTNLNTSTIKIADNETCDIKPVNTPSEDLKTATLTHEEIKAIRKEGKYVEFSYTNDFGVWSGMAYTGLSGSNYYLQINTDATSSAKGSYIQTPKFEGNIVSMKLDLYQASNHPVYLSTEKSTKSGVVATNTSSTTRTDVVFDNISGDYDQLYIVGGSIGIKQITIQYKESTDPKITVDEADAVKDIPAKGGAATVPFKAANLTGDVTASCDAAWVTDITVNGTEVSFTAAATDLATERTAVLTIASETDGVSATVEIKQAPAAPEINVTAVPEEFAAAGESAAMIEYTIAGTGAVEGAAVTATVEYADEQTGWITNILADNTAVMFDVAENKDHTRNATIVLTYAKGDTVYTTARVDVSQAHAAAVTEPTITVDAAEWAPAADGESKTFTVTLTDTEAYDVATPDWITVDANTATSLTLTASANDTGAERSATVTLSVTGGQPTEITVTQAAKPTWVEVTDFSTISTGKYIYVAVNENTYYYMSNVKASTKNVKPGTMTTAPDVAGFVPTSDMVLNFTGDQTNGFTISNDNGEYLGATSTANGVSMQSTNSNTKWVIHANSKCNFTIKQTSPNANRYLGLYSTSTSINNYRTYDNEHANIVTYSKYKLYRYNN